MIQTLIPILGGIFGQVAKKVFPDAQDELKRMDLQNQLQLAVMQHSGDLHRAAADIISAEARGEGWLQRNWRPITMITFLCLIVSRWLGWAAPNLAAEEYIKLWDIIELGLGGYTIGRSAEKILPQIAQVIKK